MFRSTRLFFLLTICTLLSLHDPPCAYACSCPGVQPLAVARERSTTVFVGKVIEQRVERNDYYSTGDPKQIVFQVSQSWKGPAYTQLVITTARGESSCGTSVEVGTEYLVYAATYNGLLTTGVCARTRPLSDPQAQQDVQALGANTQQLSPPPTGVLPTLLPLDLAGNQVSSRGGSIDNSPLIWLLVLFIAVLIATGIGVLRYRK